MATADFNGDGHPDYVLENRQHAQSNRGIWRICKHNTNVLVSGAFGPTLPAGWDLVATADFNGDGHPD